MSIKYTLLLIFILLTACATAPNFETKNIDHSLTPEKVINAFSSHREKLVIWGGTILEVRNLKDKTQIEILAYPLNESHRPMTDEKALGRFMILYPGYLESTQYAAGKQLSVLGKVSGIQSGNIGESQYTYAVINANKIHLWSATETKTFFHFGIGIQM